MEAQYFSEMSAAWLLLLQQALQFAERFALLSAALSFLIMTIGIIRLCLSARLIPRRSRPVLPTARPARIHLIAASSRINV